MMLPLEPVKEPPAEPAPAVERMSEAEAEAAPDAEAAAASEGRHGDN
jgi:hypothetical protein